MKNVSYFVKVILNDGDIIHDCFDNCEINRNEKIVLSSVGVNPIKLKLDINSIKEIHIKISKNIMREINIKEENNHV